MTRCSLYFTPRSTTVPLNLSREVKTFSCLLTSLPYQQVSGDTAWGGGESHSGGKQSLECVILSVCFSSACFPTTLCIWCQRLFVAEDLLQNTLKNDRFLECTLLCCCTKHKMCYPHLIPSIPVSVMTRGLSPKAGLVGRQGNFGLNPHSVSQRRLKFKPSSVAMVSNAAHQISKELLLSRLVDKSVQKTTSSPIDGAKISTGFQWRQNYCIHMEVHRSS